MKKTISSFRMEQESYDNMLAAIKTYSLKNIFTISQPEYIRMAIELLNQVVLKDKLDSLKVQ